MPERGETEGVRQGAERTVPCRSFFLRLSLFPDSAGFHVFCSLLFTGESCGTGHGEKMEIHTPVITIKIRHEPGEGMADKTAAFIKLAEITQKTAGIVLGHMGKSILCSSEDSIAQKAEQERMTSILDDASTAVKNLATGG